MNVEKDKSASLSAEIRSDMWLELLGSELKFLERRNLEAEKFLRMSGEGSSDISQRVKK